MKVVFIVLQSLTAPKSVTTYTLAERFVAKTSNIITRIWILVFILKYFIVIGKTFQHVRIWGHGGLPGE
jgi:hypothetical protein